jgi:hypothetical protein
MNFCYCDLIELNKVSYFLKSGIKQMIRGGAIEIPLRQNKFA